MSLSSREKTEIIRKLKLQIKELKRGREKLKASITEKSKRRPKTYRRDRYIMTVKEVFPKIIPERKSEADMCLEIQILGAFCHQNGISVENFGLLLATNSTETTNFRQYELMGYDYKHAKFALDKMERLGLVERFRNGNKLIINTVSLKGKKLIATFNEHYLKETTPEPSPKEQLHTNRADGKFEVTGQCDQPNRRTK